MGNTSQFTVNVKNIGISPQTLNAASITGTTWATLLSPLPTTPLQPGQEIQLTFQLVVPSNETGGGPGTPRVIPVTASVQGDTTFTRNFNLLVSQIPTLTFQVMVVDDVTSQPIPGAAVALDNSASIAFTDNSGTANVYVNPGVRTVFAYAANHLPNQISQLASTGASATVPVTIRLKQGQALQVSSVTTTQLTAAQIQQRGVQLSDPSNFFVYDFTVKMLIGNVTVPNVVVPAHPAAGTTVSGSFGGGGGGGGGVSGTYSIYYPTGDPIVSVQTWIIIPGDIRILKQFWDATVFINNNTSLPINGLTASLSVPNGLSLPNLFGSPQPATQSLGDLAPQSQTQASWVVRGDLPGTYQLNGTANGNLQLGGSTIPLVSSLQSSSFTVYAPKFKVDFETPSAVQAGVDFILGIDITNELPIDMQDVQVDIHGDQLVNCTLDDVATKDLGAIPANATAHTSFQFKSLVTGQVLAVQSYVSPDPVVTPPVTVNAAPLNVPNTTATTTSSIPVTIPVLDGTAGLTVLDVTDPSNGAASTDGTTATYTPADGFSGTDIFTFQAGDAFNNTGIGRVTVTVNAPVPSISSLTPASVFAGSSSVNLDVYGSGFVTASVVQWNGVNLVTTYLSSTHLRALIPAARLTISGVASVTVNTPAPGGGVFTASLAVNSQLPTLTSASQSQASVGSSDLTITLTGTNFVPHAIAVWSSGTPISLSTTFVSATQLSVQIPASLLSKAGTYAIFVRTPAPNGGYSNGVLFVVGNPVPAITSLSPDPVVAGSPDTTIAINGTGFIAGARALFGTTNLPTTFVSSTQLNVTVPASVLANPTTMHVTVTNPSPSGGASAPASFTVSMGSTSLALISAPGNQIARVNGGMVVVQVLANQGSYAATGIQITSATLNGAGSTQIVPTTSFNLSKTGTYYLLLRFPAGAAPIGSTPTLTVNYTSANAGSGTLTFICGTVH